MREFLHNASDCNKELVLYIYMYAGPQRYNFHDIFLNIQPSIKYSKWMLQDGWLCANIYALTFN